MALWISAHLATEAGPSTPSSSSSGSLPTRFLGRPFFSTGSLESLIRDTRIHCSTAKPMPITAARGISTSVKAVPSFAIFPFPEDDDEHQRWEAEAARPRAI
ncbi:hypothetical protein GW17_00027921 [Ensete ventricosum]|nr:hypothetical protein GW17_00027921 [Ensete ventricosum]RZR79290.1 hypothetical protein BHM03_00004996 [Ensete ventricosum]